MANTLCATSRARLQAINAFLAPSQRRQHAQPNVGENRNRVENAPSFRSGWRRRAWCSKRCPAERGSRRRCQAGPRTVFEDGESQQTATVRSSTAVLPQNRGLSPPPPRGDQLRRDRNLTSDSDRGDTRPNGGDRERGFNKDRPIHNPLRSLSVRYRSRSLPVMVNFVSSPANTPPPTPPPPHPHPGLQPPPHSSARCFIEFRFGTAAKKTAPKPTAGLVRAWALCSAGRNPGYRNVFRIKNWRGPTPHQDAHRFEIHLVIVRMVSFLSRHTDRPAQQEFDSS